MPFERTLPRAGENDRAVGKRKAPHLQVDRSHREESKSFPSYHNKTTDGKGTVRNGSCANSKLKTKVIVGNHKSVMGLGKDKSMFVFGANAGPSKAVGLDQRPCSLSNAAGSVARPDITGNV